MNRKIGSLTIDAPREMHRRLIKSIEDGGFVLILDRDTGIACDYIIASKDESDHDAPLKHIYVE